MGKRKAKENEPKSSSPADIVGIGSGTAVGGLEALEQWFGEMPPDLGFSIVVVPHFNTDGSDVVVDQATELSPLEVIELGDLPVEPQSKEEVQTAMEALSRARSDLQNLLDGTQIATIFLDCHGNINSFTPSAAEVYNLKSEDVGRPLGEIAHHAVKMPPLPRFDSNSRSSVPIEDEIEIRGGKWFLRRVIPYRHEDHPEGSILTFVDLSAQKRTTMRLAVARDVTQLLSFADSFQEVVPQILEAVRCNLNAEFCALWVVDKRGTELSCAEIVTADDERLQMFVSKSRSSRFKRGEGLAGHVWETGKPHWVGDLTDTERFLRNKEACDCGLVSGAAMPIITGRRFWGAIEFFANRPLVQEASLLEMLSGVGHEIGQFIRRVRLHDSLRDEESRKTAILKASLDCIITMDIEGRIVDFNSAAERTFQVARNEVAGKPLAEVLIPEELRDAHRTGLQRFLKTGKSDIVGQRVELSARRADGSQFPIELAISVSSNRDGTPFFTAYLRDITERKAIEEVLHQRANLASLHASLSVSLAGEGTLKEILQTCCLHVVDALDAALARVWLVNEGEQTLHLKASAGMYTHLESDHSRVPLGEFTIGRIAALRQPLQTNDVSHDPIIRDPQWGECRGMVAFAGYPLVVENRVVGVFALFAKHELAPEVFEQLMTMSDAVAQCIARKKSEQDLIERERKLNLALDAGRLATWHWDIVADCVTWSNQLYDLFGYTKEQFIPTRAGFLAIVHPDDRRYVTEQLNAVFTGTCEEYDMEFRILRGDDKSIVWTSGRGVIHRDEQNRPLSIVAVASDITENKHWELELADREAHLRRVIDNMIGFVAVMDAEGTLLEANETALRSGGVARDSVIGKKFWDCYWWNYDSSIMDQLRGAVQRAARGETVRYDVTVRMAGDSRLEIDFMLVPVRDKDGAIHYLIPSGVDIQDRKESERKLADAKLRLDLALEVSEAAAWSWDRKKNQPMPDENLNRLFGFDSDESPALDAFLARMDDADRARVSESIERSLKNGAKYEEEYRVNLPSGETRWLRARGRTQQSTDGNFEDFLGVVSDITDRKAAEHRLLESEQRLRMALKAGSMAAWEWRPNESVWTEALYSLLGIPADTPASPEVFFACVYEPDVEGLKDAWARATEGEIPYQHEFRIRRPDGELRWLAAVGEFERSRAGKVTRIYGLNWDVTEQREAAEATRASERRAQQASVAKSEFIANMSHEIRTPMTAVLGYADLLAARENDAEKSEYLRTIKQNGEFLLEIINDILDLSKIEAGKLEVTREKFPLHRIIADVRSTMNVRARERQLEFQVEYDGKIPRRIESDGKRLRQILVNLIGNAIKFTEKGSVILRVTYLADEADPRVRMAIVDTGIGISAEQQARLFQAFSQADASVSRNFGGTGLGLAISQRLARLLDGEISVHSTPGEGSTFTCTISAGEVHGEKLIEPSNDSNVQKPAEQQSDQRLRCRVLVVDDRRDVRFLSQRILSCAGAEVSLAEDGIEALKMVKEAMIKGETWDLILLDMQMPRLDGYQTAKRLREMKFDKPIIALTADAMHGDMGLCLQSGCDAYLSKPIDSKQLIDTVAERVFGYSRISRERHSPVERR